MNFTEWLIKIGEKGLGESWQAKFPKTTPCVHCGGSARIAFTAKENNPPYICDLHLNKKNSMWLHDSGAFATYLCSKCLEPTTLYNQA